MKKFIIIFVCLILAVVIIGSIISGVKKKKGNISEKVKSHVVETGGIVVKLEETGEIRPKKEIDIKSKISGKIVKFFFDEGDYIDNGDIIAEVEPDYTQAERIFQVKSNLELAEIRLKNAKRDFEDKSKLYADNFLSQNELESYEDALTEAKINYKSALQQYELIKEIETEGNLSNIVATASGTIIQRVVEEGEMVVSSTSSFSEGTVIMKVANLQKMIVSSKINEVDISKITENQEVKIQVDAYPYESYRGKIAKIAAMAVDYNGIKAFPLEIEVMNVDIKLKPGMTANITIIGEKKKDIVVVPIRTIFSDEDGQDIVYKVSNDTISTSIQVKTGINDFQQVEIITGLSVGDSVSFSEPKKPLGNANMNKGGRF